MNGNSAQDSKLFSQNPYGLELSADEHTFLVAVLTFAILFYLSVVLDAGKHLGENHQKLAIPAEYVKGGGKEKARHDGGPPRSSVTAT
jgi:hypothetical protein